LAFAKAMSEGFSRAWWWVTNVTFWFKLNVKNTPRYTIHSVQHTAVLAKPRKCKFGKPYGHCFVKVQNARSFNLQS
jgi:hypothetical protein